MKIGFPVEYEDENNIVRNGLFLREPEIKELEKRLKEINKITDLKQQVKKQKEVIDKVMKIINYYGTDKEHNDNSTLRYVLKDILDILKEVSK